MDNRDTYADEGYLLRIGEAARRIGVSVDTLRRWDSQGTLVARRLPSRPGQKGQRLYDPAEVAEFIAGLAS